MPDLTGASDRQYRRGAIMGLTMTEAFVLIAFILLLLLGAWKVQADAREQRTAAVAHLRPEQLAGLAALAELPPEQIDAALAIARRDQLAAAAALVEDGLDLRPSLGLADPAERWRFIDSDELRRVLDGAAALPDDVQRDLADLVEIEDPAGLAEILERTRRAPVEDELERRLSAIGGRLEAAQGAERAMVADLRRTLGAEVARIGGRIEADGAIVLPDAVLFERGQARITERMQAFLEVACRPWLGVLMRSEAPVAGAKIEGHASSEWRRGSSPGEAYVANLDLSQRRSQAVLRACLDVVGEPATERWARRHLVAVGYSSARPVLDGDVEDRVRSRRVVFSVALDDAALLRDVEEGVHGGLVASGQGDDAEAPPSP